MWNKFLVLVFLAYISLVTSNSVSFITKCKLDDPKCIKESSQKAIPMFANGIPELNVDQLDPLVLKHVDASTPNLKLSVTDITVTGLRNCEAKKVQTNPDKSQLIVKVLCTTDFVGKYDMKGQLFVLPIEGNGDLIATVRKIQITADVDLIDKIGKDGKKYWDVKSWRHSFELKDKSDVKFENLFPNNEFLRKSTNELIASNGNDVIIEIGEPIIKAVSGKVVESIKKFFAKVPLEDITLE